ncbi:hypothetical protein H9650_04215 [Psychrobacillus sp. Sa2BUA9]|uniref:Uncharacterized protein n=1 Tax=Psychrobacillus faecigallinarum TaxID=2762235 RepID=A0ABR8R6C6_9BACI|nr:hypothetical protein [Psychrobacillus faecigallinarum]MBD7943315.1 hypothetical protein [Psychrobacillus faecigallinarum]
MHIPFLLESLDIYSKNGFNHVKVIGVKARNIKYIVESPINNLKHIPLIASEYYSIYDLQLDFEKNMLQFYIKSVREASKEEILQSVFEAILVEYSPKKYGFFTSPREKGRAESALQFK